MPSKIRTQLPLNNIKNSQTSAFKAINTTLTLNGTTCITIFEGVPQDFSPYSVDCHTIDINVEGVRLIYGRSPSSGASQLVLQFSLVNTQVSSRSALLVLLVVMGSHISLCVLPSFSTSSQCSCGSHM